MIGYLNGKIIEVTSDHAIIECQGVGYEVFGSIDFLSELADQKGLAKGPLSVWIHTQVREDAITLYGFLNKRSKMFFLSLLKVNGVGPKMAVNIMSGGSVDSLMSLIESEDAKALSKLPKVGKKTAEQIILTLKGKLVKLDDETGQKTALKSNALAGSHREISSALINLGFRSQDVDRVLVDFPKEIELEEGIRTALSALTTI
jgi:Holliday junction DNA helicase RuvA